MLCRGISLGAAQFPLWRTVPAVTGALLVTTAGCTTLGAAVLLALLIKGCRLPGSQLEQHTTCSQEQWQVLAAALVAQLSFAAVTVQAIVAENAEQLRTSTAFNGLSGLIWLLFLAVVGQPLPVDSKVGWGVLTVVCTAAQFVLLHLTYNQLGWRQHSWLSCDPRRKHAAQRQELWSALNRYLAYSRSCMCILALSFVNGLVLALTTNPAGSAGAVVLTPPAQARFLQDTPEDRMKEGRVGVLVSAGLTVLPMLWLALARCAVHHGSQKMEFVASVTCVVAGLLPAFQLYFVFSDYFSWPQRLVVRLLLLAAPMAVRMILLAVTWSAFRRVMSILRQPWVLEAASSGGSTLLTATWDDEQDAQVPELLKPLMQGAWLLKQSMQSTACPGLMTSKTNSTQTLSLTGNPSSGSNSMMTNKAAAAAVSTTWQSLLNACSSRPHYRFFQLSLDGTTLRWSWNKYVLMYFVESLTCDPAGLTIILHCVLEPDLHLTFQDATTWRQWVDGLQLALQWSTGLPASAAAAPGGEQDAAGEPDHPAAAAAAAAAADPAAHAEGGGRGNSPLPCPILLQHQMVRSALYTQQSMQRLQAGSSCCAGHHAGGCASWLGLPPLLGTSKRHSQYDPAARHLLQAQEMALNMQAVAACALAAATMTTGLVPSHNGTQEVRHNAELQHAGGDTDTTQRPAACPHQQIDESTATGSAVSTSAQATATGASTMFGAFKIPASLQVDHMMGVPQLIAAYSSSAGSGNDSSAGGKSKPANYSYLPQTFSIGSSSGGGSGKQQAQVSSVLNAGYCLSPLGLSAAQKQQQQQNQLQAAVLHAHLPHLPSKQHLLLQTLQWLQEGGSGSCPESDGPQTSPSYSWDSAQLLSLGGASSSQVLPLLQQQQSAASPASGGGSARIQLGSAAGSLQGVLQQVWSGAGSAHWAGQLAAAPAQQRGQCVGSPLGPGVAAVAVGSSGQTHMPFSKLHISRSVSLPATHSGFGVVSDTPAQSSQAADPSDALAQLLAQGPDCAGAQGVQTIPDDAGQLQCNSDSEGYSSGNNVLFAEMCSSEERRHVNFGPDSVRQLAARLQDPAAAGAGSDDAVAESPAAAAEKQQKVSWGTASFRSIAAALRSMTHSISNRSRAVSIAGNISEQAAAATESSSPTPASQAAGSGSDNSSPPDKSAASMRSMQSTRRRDSSFSMRHSFGSVFGSFAGRSTWSEFEPPFSVATIDSEDGEGRPAPAAAAEPEAAAAEQQQQQLLQQDGWRMRSSKEEAAGLTPVLSANSEDLKRLAAQEQPESEEPRALVDSCSFRMPLANQSQQEQVQQAVPTDEGVLDMHAAYQIALRSTASEGGRKLSRDAQAAVLPTIHSIDAHSADKQPACSASRTQSWLIASAPAAAAAGEPNPRSAPADSAAEAAAGSSSPYDTALPPLSVRVASPANQPSGAAGGLQHAHLVQQPHWLMQLLHGSQPLSAAAGTPQSASAPQLHHDDGFAVRSPTASVASLSSHFSHGTSMSINSYWWLDGCGGSPSAARSRQQTSSPVSSDQPQPSTSGLRAFEPGSSVSGEVASTGFKFPAATQSCTQSCGSPVGQVLAGSAPGQFPGRFPASPAAAASPVSARISAGLALRPAVSPRPSSAASVMEAASKLSNTASLKRGDLPQVPVPVIPWRKLHRGRQLGQGSEGTVVEASYLDSPVAIKEGLSDSEIDMFLSAGSHDNLVGLRGVTRKHDGSWCLVLEHCGRGTLDTLLHHFRTPLARAPPPLPPPTPAQLAAAAAAQAADGGSGDAPQAEPLTRPDAYKCLKLMRGVGRGVLHLHTHQPAILHRDIKPANIFVGHGMQMKIGDLGMARFVFPTPAPSSASRSRSPSPLRCDPLAAVKAAVRSPQHSHDGGSGYSSGPGTPTAPAARTFTPGIVGTIAYTAPEVLGVRDEPQEQPDVDTVLKADTYSFGVTLWESIERKRPWQGMDGMQLWTMWVSDPTNVKLPPLSVRDAAGPGERAIFAALQSLVDDCTALEPTQRPTMEVVVERIISVQDMYAVLMGDSAAGSAGSVSGEPGSDCGFFSAAGSLSVDGFVSAAGSLSEEGSRTQSPDADSPL